MVRPESRLRTYWRSTPGAAKLAFGVMLVTALYYAGFFVTAQVLGGGNMPVAGRIIAGVFTVLMLLGSVAAPQLLIALALRSARFKWAGAILAGIVSLAGLAFGAALLFPAQLGLPAAQGQAPVQETLLWAPVALLGVVYAVITVWAVRDARRGPQRPALGAPTQPAGA